MTLIRRARIPVACLPANFARTLDDHARRREPWVGCDLTVDGPTITSVTPSAPPPDLPSAPYPA